MTRHLPQGVLSVERMCVLARVSRAGYYRSWQTSAPREEETGLRDAIHRIAIANRHYGYRRIGAVLRREGWRVNHKRVLSLMRKDNLLCLREHSFVPMTTDSAHGWQIVPNLTRKLELTRLDQLWVADITYIRLAEEFVYLAVILDAHSRMVVGWALADHLQASLAIEALAMALDKRRPRDRLIHHSDRGIQYASHEYMALLRANNIRPSMSRAGNPYDNAKAESFMKTLKAEEADGRSYRNLQDVRREIGQFIDKVYNRTRLHSALDYQSPEEFEARYKQAVSVVAE